MKTRDEYFDKLLDLVTKHIEATSLNDEAFRKREVLRFCATNHLHPCEHCKGEGEISVSRDGVGQDWDCNDCNGTGSDIELETTNL